MIKALLIDPAECRICEIEIDGSSTCMNQVISSKMSCAKFEQGYAFDNGNIVLVDSVGLVNKKNRAFELNDIIIFGKAIVVGVAKKIDSYRSCSIPAASMTNLVRFCNADRTRELREARTQTGWRHLPLNAN